MMATRFNFSTRNRSGLRRHALAQATLFLAASQALAQASDQPAQVITVSGKSGANAASIAGFGDTPLWQSPFSATVINLNQLRDAGIIGLGDLTRLDAGISDAYNPPGYWSQLSVRGFTLDNRFNYRRDGLPINAETVIGQANKQAIEILKGTSGLQAGTSAPGGLVNQVVKRPQGRIRGAAVGWEQDGTLTSALDLGDQLGSSVSWRINASADHLEPTMQNSRGQRWLMAAAVDAELARGTLLQAEYEQSRQSQPSTPGFSLLGNRLPNAKQIDPTLNLNNQAWTLPVEMAGQTGSLRLTHSLGQKTELVAQLMRQRLDSDDRIAFPFGCSAENDYSRYCSNGSFDFYDYRSDGERRSTDAAKLALTGQARWLGMGHQYSLGVLHSRYQARFNRQAYNWVGVGTVDGLATVPADPSLTDENTNRDERSTEWFVQDHITLSPSLSLWAGLRSTHLQRESVRTDGTRATAYSQSLATPWLALSHQLGPRSQAYLSWGQGVESEVAPNRSRYTNAGQALPALKSRQIEAGIKAQGSVLDWRLALFDIQRPMWGDIAKATGLPTDSCSNAAPCTRTADGQANHRGIEAEAEWRAGAWSVRGSAMLLSARREGSADATANGLRPTNVPASSLKLQAAYNLAGVPGLALLGFISHEGQRMVLPDNSVAAPGWTRIDVGLRYSQRMASRTVVWRAGIDNLADQRAWKEVPFQYGHAYLYPLAPRTAHASVQVNF